jgi:hypothetical protein
MDKEYPPAILGDKLFWKGIHGAYSNVYEAQQNPNLLVKSITHVTIDSVINSAKLSESAIGDFLPEHHIVKSGKNDVDYTSYIIMEKVVSHNLNSKLAKKYYALLDQLCYRVILAFMKNPAVTNAAPIYYGTIPDIASRNLIFGTTKSDSEPRLYCVDLFPTITRPINKLRELISDILNSHAQDYNFIKTKQALERLKIFEDNYVNS